MKTTLFRFISLALMLTMILVLFTTAVGATPTENPLWEGWDFGDAPEGATAVAYPSLGVFGAFPTCAGAAGWIQHTSFAARFGPTFDFEFEGNAGECPGCFPPYDVDECFADDDAGLMFPEPYTIQSGAVVPCPNATTGTPLGTACQTAVWGIDVDIDVHNHMLDAPPTVGYVNVLMDWNQDGQWGGTSTGACSVSEHVLVNFPIPSPYGGPLSALLPPNFTIGPNSGYVWTRFSITDQEVVISPEWTGEGEFGEGETEDYLLEIELVPIGGMTAPASAFALLAPWVVLAALAAVIAATALILKRRTV